MIKKPKVSIILPVYNGERYLYEQVLSIIQQKFKDWELIICDDASSDQTLRVAEDLCSSSTKIRIVKNKYRQGVGKNFESGLVTAKGELIALCDSDDYWLTDKLQNQVDYLNMHKEIGLVYHDVFITDSNLNIQTNSSFRKRLKGNIFSLHRVNVEKDDLKTLLKENHITGPTMVFRSSLIDKIIPLQTNFAQDGWIVLICSAFTKIAYIDKQLIKYRQHQNNATGSKIKGYSYYFSNLFRKEFGVKSSSDFTRYLNYLIELRSRLPHSKPEEIELIENKIKILKKIILLLESTSIRSYIHNVFNAAIIISKLQARDHLSILVYISLYKANPFKK